jgi:hypothetical protein
LESKEKFLEFAFTAIGSNFPSRAEFDSFFEEIGSDEQKSLFLRTASFYLFLVKCGSWKSEVPGYNEEIEYFTVTLKYISIFSLIESLLNEQHADFFQYLQRRKNRHFFPIESVADLENHFGQYNSEFGSVQNCSRFFKGLSAVRQSDLVSKLRTHGTEPTIEELAKYLYRLRSEFVHSAELVHALSAGSHFDPSSGTVCMLNIEHAMEFFEEGLVSFFSAREPV